MHSSFMKQKLFKRQRDSKHDYESSYSLLGNSDDEDPDFGEQEPLALRPKKRENHFVEHTMLPGETLLSLALRFSCSVAQIKQANNLIRENEIFALRTVRIPVTPFSLLRDGIAGIHSRPGNIKSLSEEDEDASVSSIVETSPLISLQTTENNVNDENDGNQSDESLYNPLLTPIPQPVVSLPSFSNELPALNLPEFHVAERRTHSMFDCSGSDGGISWIALVLCTLVLGFAGPLIYIFFIYEHEQKKLHHL